MSNSFVIVSFAALLLLSDTANAIEPLTAKQLDSYCRGPVSTGGGNDNGICTVYISGFLDGAVATDGRVAENVVDEIERETFTERAIRTRLSRRLRDVGPTVYAEFCVGAPVPIADVVAKVVDELAERDGLETLPARTIVYDALRRHFPCQLQSK